MRTPSLLTIFSLVLLSLFSFSAQAARPSIAVLPFSIDRHVVITKGYTQFSGVVEDESSLLTNELIHQLVATRKFDVLERSRIDDLLQEKELQESDFASPDEALKLAKLLGADYFVLGRIDAFDTSSSTKSVPYSTQTYQQQETTLELYMRIIDARTGRIVAAEKFNKEAKVRVNADKKTPSSSKTILEQASLEMVGRITDNVFPLRVAKSDGKTFYINRGNDGTLKVNDMVRVFSQSEQLFDSDTGESMGYTENEVAQARIVAVDTRFTKAEITEGEGVKDGMLVRRTDKTAPKPAAAKEELPAGPRW